MATIEKVLAEHGLEKNELGEEYIAAVEWDFSRHRSFLLQSMDIRAYASEIALLGSGYFSTRGSGLAWDPVFKKSLLNNYPERSFEDSLLEAGLLPEIIGRARISNLKHAHRMMMKKQAQAMQAVETPTTGSKSSERADAYLYCTHPYVSTVDGRSSITMTEPFFNEARPLRDLRINEVLEIYGIDPQLLSGTCLSEIWSKLMNWTKTDARQEIGADRILRIQWKRMKALHQTSEALFEEIRQDTRKLRPLQKKVICRQIREYPTNLEYPCGYSLREILKKVGISKTTYYNALNKRNYGQADVRRQQQDEKDLEMIRVVAKYKGFEKGLRQIYMMMPDVAGQRFAMSKIRRLMRKAGIKTSVRQENPARQRAREFHERNTKPNLLRRQFRLHRPNEVRLTDVTYLDYGPEHDRKRAYGSSCIDPVTGKLLVLNASENNDLPLAMETLARLKEYPTVEGALFHSDQGILYLTDEFQEEVKAMGMIQSMSKRGNCWDNAPQESFFGHFKDECHYEDCESFGQLQALLDEYAYYYNHERHQWDRRQMTPIQYEAWLESLSEEEFAEYLQAEQEKYDTMKENAEKKAIERAKTLGV